MKKVLLFACTLTIAGSLFCQSTSCNRQSIKRFFKQTFSEAQNVVWSDAQDMFMVKFTQLGIRTTVKYDTEGNFLSSLRYYSGEQLPVDIQCKLKKYSRQNYFWCNRVRIGR